MPELFSLILGSKTSLVSSKDAKSEKRRSGTITPSRSLKFAISAPFPVMDPCARDLLSKSNNQSTTDLVEPTRSVPFSFLGKDDPFASHITTPQYEYDQDPLSIPIRQPKPEALLSRSVGSMRRTVPDLTHSSSSSSSSESIRPVTPITLGIQMPHSPKNNLVFATTSAAPPTPQIPAFKTNLSTGEKRRHLPRIATSIDNENDNSVHRRPMFLNAAQVLLPPSSIRLEDLPLRPTRSPIRPAKSPRRPSNAELPDEPTTPSATTIHHLERSGSVSLGRPTSGSGRPTSSSVSSGRPTSGSGRPTSTSSSSRPSLEQRPSVGPNPSSRPLLPSAPRTPNAHIASFTESRGPPSAWRENDGGGESFTIVTSVRGRPESVISSNGVQLGKPKAKNRPVHKLPSENAKMASPSRPTTPNRTSTSSRPSTASRPTTPSRPSTAPGWDNTAPVKVVSSPELRPQTASKVPEEPKVIQPPPLKRSTSSAQRRPSINHAYSAPPLDPFESFLPSTDDMTRRRVLQANPQRPRFFARLRA